MRVSRKGFPAVLVDLLLIKTEFHKSVTLLYTCYTFTCYCKAVLSKSKGWTFFVSTVITFFFNFGNNLSNWVDRELWYWGSFDLEYLLCGPPPAVWGATEVSLVILRGHSATGYYQTKLCWNRTLSSCRSNIILWCTCTCSHVHVHVHQAVENKFPWNLIWILICIYTDYVYILCPFLYYRSCI